ncbi:hypothetical protein CTAM01_09974 [Colletotrichum tamarilloi]|uniref:Uncharacterized protein n=1 Tax=Colletotrichum tamarilloi TaxID=1209934 RepID=A0ABQ9R200_9PEZI|nr:uncharacterized protein CTAM01_09974 [Colletotrichum tamarilloi]KAK1492180.1 hypothetical protein CTAM01_09974 [Colletotrichum tamarilloi]
MNHSTSTSFSFLSADCCPQSYISPYARNPQSAERLDVIAKGFSQPTNRGPTLSIPHPGLPPPALTWVDHQGSNGISRSTKSSATTICRLDSANIQQPINRLTYELDPVQRLSQRPACRRPLLPSLPRHFAT